MMINVRETEIREESLELVLESYRLANLINDSSKQSFRAQFVDAAFLVSSNIAKAFISLQDEKFETEIAQALTGIDILIEYITNIETDSLIELKDIKPIQVLLAREQYELQELLAASQTFKNTIISPKLEKACI